MPPRRKSRSTATPPHPTGPSWRRLLVNDLVVTALWVFLSSLIGEVAASLQSALGLQDTQGADVVLSIGAGLALMLAFSPLPMYVFSSAIFNPANSLALLFSAKEPPALSAGRMAAQHTGAVAGALAATNLIPLHLQGKFAGLAGGLRPGISVALGFSAELVLTLLMNLLFLTSTDMKNKRLAFWLPLMATTVWIYVGSFFTGPSLNPSISFSWDRWYRTHSMQEHVVVFWGGPLLGSVLAGLVYQALSCSLVSANAKATPIQAVCCRRQRAARGRRVPAVQVETAQLVETASDAAELRAFFYDGVVFDMDGTLTEAHIDFEDMRKRTGIPMGDLFTVMEAWNDPAAIKEAMDTILEIEAEAASRVSAKQGLLDLLQMLKARNVRVALVTRNTRASVAAFMDLIGPEWAGIFSIVLTREFEFVKPDKRLLHHVAQVWGVPISRLLMVGDSLEDVEVGNAAGAATCLVAGGGNEKPGAAPAAPPPGAVATFTVTGLPQLAEQLVLATEAAAARAARIAALRSALQLPSAEASLIEDDDTGSAAASARSSGPAARCDSDSCEHEACAGRDVGRTIQAPCPALPGDLSAPVAEYPEDEAELDVLPGVGPLAGHVRLGWPARVAAGLRLTAEGAPPPGLDFVDWLEGAGALRLGACSFPTMGRSAGGLATCAPAQVGDRVLHVCCGQGGLTKLMASQGMRVVGVDLDVSAAQRRGLTAVPFTAPRPLARHSLQGVRAAAGLRLFDVLLLCSTPGAEVPDTWWCGEALQEMAGLLQPGGRLCAQVDLAAVQAAGPRRRGATQRGRAASINPAAIINSINSNGMTVVAWQLVDGSHGASTGGGGQLRLVARPHED